MFIIYRWLFLVMLQIILYELDGCPSCALVRQKLDERKLSYETVTVPRDRSDPLRQELFQKSGVPTVPVLQLGDLYIGESAEIIAYVEERF